MQAGCGDHRNAQQCQTAPSGSVESTWQQSGKERPMIVRTHHYKDYVPHVRPLRPREIHIVQIYNHDKQPVHCGNMLGERRIFDSDCRESSPYVVAFLMRPLKQIESTKISDVPPPVCSACSQAARCAPTQGTKGQDNMRCPMRCPMRYHGRFVGYGRW